ncbi:MAG: ATP-binding protein [Acidimicrobiia bacterium]
MTVPSALIGRDRDLENLTHLQDTHRLVTVVGPGGVGKTTLVNASVEGVAGVLFGRLAPLPDRDLADALAGALGFGSYEAMHAALADRTALLVLDNCEHVIDAAADIAQDLLDRHRGLSILATSREQLGLPGERVLALSPLSTDGSPSPAAEMFLARMIERGLATPDDLTDIESLCRSLDGLPLALELAASRASALTAHDIEQNLATRLDLLSRKRERGPERHQSISATVGWSFHLLEPDLQDTFLTVAVFAGSFTARMATAMTGSEDQGGVSDALATLVERSLIVHEPARGRSWYRMLSTIRAYGVEKLKQDDRWEELNERLVDQAVEAALRLADQSVAQDDPSFAEEVGRLFRVFRSALDWCLAHDETPNRASNIVFALLGLEDTGFQAEAADAIDAVVNRWQVEDARIYGALAMMSRSAGQFDRAIKEAERCVELGGDGVVFGYRILGLSARAQGDYGEAAEFLGLGVEQARSSGLDGLAYELETHIALALARSGDLDGAVAQFDRIEAEAAEFGMVAAMAPLMAGLVLVAEDLDASIAATSRALEKAEAIGYAWAINHSREQLAIATYLSGDEAIGMAEMASTVEYAATRGSRSETWLGIRFMERMFASHHRMDLAKACLAASKRVFGTPTLGPTEQNALDAIWPHPVDDRDATVVRIPELCNELRLLAESIDASSAPHPTNPEMARSGEMWILAFESESATLAATKGLVDIAELLARPRQEVASIDLMGAAVVTGDAGPMSDPEARRNYERRIRDLQEAIEDAEQNNDVARVEIGTLELDTLIEHLAASYGLGGAQRTVSDVTEKARTAVTWRIRSAIKKIAQDMPLLGTHLDRSIKTGRFCVYDPEPPTTWDVTM